MKQSMPRQSDNSYMPSKNATGKPITITINIAPGPATPAMKVAWRRLWSKVISEVKNDLQAEGEAKGDQT